MLSAHQWLLVCVCVCVCVCARASYTVSNGRAVGNRRRMDGLMRGGNRWVGESYFLLQLFSSFSPSVSLCLLLVLCLWLVSDAAPDDAVTRLDNGIWESWRIVTDGFSNFIQLFIVWFSLVFLLCVCHLSSGTFFFFFSSPFLSLCFFHNFILKWSHCFVFFFLHYRNGTSETCKTYPWFGET